jgi:hypothetical protein
MFKMEGNVVWLEGVQCKEMWPKVVTIVRVKTIPKFNVVILVCQVAGVNEGVTVVLKSLIVLKDVIFTIHSHSGRIFDEIS